MKEIFLNTLLKSLYGIMILLGAVIVKAYYFFFWIIFWEGKLYIDSSGGGYVVEYEPIPEPATMLLLGTGLVGVGGAARRKKKNQA